MASSSCVHGFNLSSGFKFLPTDQELLGYYLLNKVLGKPFKYDSRVMIELNLYKAEPWDLWNRFGGPRLNQGEDLYIFTELKKVSNNGSNVARTTGSGTWKGDTSGSEVYVSEDNKKILGSWKRFHYKPNEPNENGSWIMVEYKLDDSLIPKSFKGSDLVLCRIRKDRKRKLIEDQMNDSSQSSRRKVPRVDNQDGMSTHGKHILNDDTNLLASFTQFLGSEEEQKPQQQQVDSNMRFEEHELQQQDPQVYVSPSPSYFHEQQQKLDTNPLMVSSDHYILQSVKTYEPMDVQPSYFHVQQQHLPGDDLMGFSHHDKFRRVENYESMSIVNAHHLENPPLQDGVPFDNLFTVDELYNEASAATLVASEPQPTNFYCAANGNVLSYNELDDNVFREAYHPEQNNDVIAAAVDESQFDDGSWLADLMDDNNSSEYPAAK
ncbi:hypothetical protein ACLB2K_010964 [Fragaria x ananassa]